MVGSYVLGMTAIIGMAWVWVGIQSIWRHTFAGDPLGDVLSQRCRCDHTSCGSQCSGSPITGRKETP